MTRSPQRLHALDAARAFALLAGIVFHATVSFLPGPTMWIVTDVDRSLSLSLLFYVLHMFRMTAFFLLAGFFGAMMVDQKGVGGFVRDRAKRIGLVLVVFWPLAIGGVVAAAIWGAIVMGKGAPLPPPPKPPAGMIAPFPLAHLWFLYLLLIFYAVALPVRGVVLADRSGRLSAAIDRTVSFLAGSRFGPLVLAAPLAAALSTHQGWVMWGGVPTPDQSLVPNAPAFVGFGAAFAFGWILHRKPDLLALWGRRCALNLCLAVAATVAALSMVGIAPNAGLGHRDARTAAYAVLYAFAAWAWTLAFIGLALRFLSKESRRLRYIAEASYWMYLIHLPIVMALQVAVSQIDWPWQVKLPIILLGAMGTMLASYALLVRHTWLGGWLNGKRYPRRARIPTNSSDPAVEATR